MKKLRSGYTTGACAAAAAKAAVQLLITGKPKEVVEIPFPDGRRVVFVLESAETSGMFAEVAVKKDAGDDPDVTNRALIIAKVRFLESKLADTHPEIIITGGQGVGIVTKPGLSVAVGRPAINPVPLKMIREAVLEAVDEQETRDIAGVEVCIMVPKGEELARKTLNKRLGILGGISILGTTGIVKPVSADAWTATIASSMSVAHASGVEEIILSTGRSSERCVASLLNPPEEALVMMGDYLQFALEEAKKCAFKHIHMAAMWAKLLKGAMRIPQTHVRHGVLEIDQALHFFSQNGVKPAIIERLRGSNTAREILERLLDMNNMRIVDLICKLACNYYQEIAQTPVTVHLVHGSGKHLCSHSSR
ncbi:MAG: cobalt-precorrin-5B (C(1))-methyltransferase [Desulfobacterales bacterium]|nr:cobalt-precorrin-5B (C(1))-methyltransferase [Desulfobacterales bacterium]